MCGYCKIILLGLANFRKNETSIEPSFFKLLFKSHVLLSLECHVAFKYDVVILLNDVPLPHTNMLKNVDEKFRENI